SQACEALSTGKDEGWAIQRTCWSAATDGPRVAAPSAGGQEGHREAEEGDEGRGEASPEPPAARPEEQQEGQRGDADSDDAEEEGSAGHGAAGVVGAEEREACPEDEAEERPGKDHPDRDGDGREQGRELLRHQ